MKTTRTQNLIAAAHHDGKGVAPRVSLRIARLLTMTALDVAALLILGVVGVAGIGLLVVLAILPGRIAQRRQHPQTDAIRVTGYLGILLAPLWVLAFIWAYTRPGTFEVASAVAGVNERITMLEQHVGVAPNPVRWFLLR